MLKRELSMILLLVLLVAGCTKQTDIEQWMKDEEAAWSSQDADKISVVYADDCIYEDLAVPKLCRGKDEIRAFMVETFKGFPDFKSETTSYFVSGDHVCSNSS